MTPPAQAAAPSDPCPRCGALRPASLLRCPFCGEGQGPGAPAITPEEERFADQLYLLPRVTTALLVVMVALFVLMEWLGDSEDSALLTTFGARASELVRQGEVWRLVTASFLHIGPLHLVFNGVALAQLGMICENVYGRSRVWLLFVITGVGGFALGSALSEATSAGASAGLFGLMGACLVFGWRHKISIPPYYRSLFTWTLAPWLALSLIDGMVRQGNIDNLAHIGGLLTGVVMAWPMSAPILEQARPRRWEWVDGAAAACLLAALGAAATVGSQLSREWEALRWQQELEEGQLPAELEPPEGVEPSARHELAWLGSWDARIEAAPTWGIYYVERARVHLRAGQRGQAEEDLREALALGHDPAGTRNELAWVLLTGQDPRPAQIREGLKLARQSVGRVRSSSNLNTLGWALYLSGEYDAARERLEEALEGHDGPGQVLDHYMLAMTWSQLGEAARAREHLRQGGELHSTAREEAREEMSPGLRLEVEWSLKELELFEQAARAVVGADHPGGADPAADGATPSASR